MKATAAVLRMEIEASLARRIPAALSPRLLAEQESVPCGIGAIDALRAFPRGSLVEICGAANSGRTAILHGILAEATQAGEACALIDGSDAFDPVRARQNGVELHNLLWVRSDPRVECSYGRRRLSLLDKMLIAVDLLLQGGGFGVLALDLANCDLKEVACIPLATWFRLRRAVDNTRTLLVVLEERAAAGSSASVVLEVSRTGLNVASTSQTDASHTHVDGESLFDAMSSKVNVARGQARKPVQSASATAGFTTHFSSFV